MIDTIALILIIVGALNWGSVGIFGVDAVAWLFGGQLSIISRIIYTLIALAGVWSISLFSETKKKQAILRTENKPPTHKK